MEKYSGQRQLSFRYSFPVGPRSIAAGVTLRLIGNDIYKFETLASWPNEDLSEAVERGVRDGLSAIGFDPDLGIRVVLEEIEWDPVNSSIYAFYVAARHIASFGRTLEEVRSQEK